MPATPGKGDARLTDWFEGGTGPESGIMLGLGETSEEIEAVMQDLHDHDCNMITLGQYLQPSKDHLPVSRYVTPEEFDRLAEVG